MAKDMYDVELGEPDDGFMFNDAQLEVVQSNEREISKREKEINQITKSINSLAEVFKDIQTMVIDQGTILDRIDYNVETTVVNLQQANQELQKSSDHQKSTTNRLCIMILIFLIAIMFLILIFKPRRS
jgi:syntaxin 16